MTKRELLRALEPFDDEIDIEVQNIERPRYNYYPNIYYVGFTATASAKIVLGASKPQDVKCVELKI